MKTFVVSVLILFCFPLVAAEPRPAFSEPLTAKREGDAVRIQFAVDRPTDVAVTIENAQGKIVRHLVAGLLGKNPPEPLRAESLWQSLVWDGKDDAGMALAVGPFRVRVQLAMRGEFDRFLFYRPEATGPISTVAVGPKGTLYVFHRDGTVNGNMGGHKVRLYHRDGSPHKVLVPFPADIAAERVRPLGTFQTATGELVPHVHNFETLSFYPDRVGVRGRDMPELSCPAVDSRGRVYWLAKGLTLVAVDADGGIPYESFLGPRLLPDIKELRLAGEGYHFWSEKPCLAVSSDDQFVYFAGLATGHGDYKQAQPLPCVFRANVTTREAEVFLGDLDRPGNDRQRLTAPRGLAVAQGLVYVADPPTNRVVAFREADRSYAGEIAVDNPQVIGVAASGAVYVCAYTGTQTAELIKFSGLGGKELYRQTLPRTGLSPNPGAHRIAVDASVEPVRIWLPQLYGDPVKLHAYDDLGDRFVDRGDVRQEHAPRDEPVTGEPDWRKVQRADRDGHIGPRDISVDRVRDEVYIKAGSNTTFRLDDRSGEITGVIDAARVASGTVLASQLVPGQDGSLYVFTWNRGLWRLDRDGRPKNWDRLDTHSLPLEGMMCFQLRHLALKPHTTDEVYVIATADYLTKNKQDAGKFLTLNAIGQDGRTSRTLIWQCLNGAVPRFDARGNIYIADLVKPIDRSYPEFFDGRLAPPPQNTGGGDQFWNSYMYGSVIKFPPTGGIIWHQPTLPKSTLGEPPAELLAQPRVPFKRHYAYSPHLTGTIQGALWTRFGYAPYSAHMSGNTSHCMCEGSGFDVDPFGRVFFPNLGQFRIEVVDTNNNPLTTMGQYGNEDSGGPGARVARPAIPLAWPTYVGVTDRHAYIADTVNRRVVRVKLRYAAEAACEVRK